MTNKVDIIVGGLIFTLILLFTFEFVIELSSQEITSDTTYVFFDKKTVVGSWNKSYSDSLISESPVTVVDYTYERDSVVIFTLIKDGKKKNKNIVIIRIPEGWEIRAVYKESLGWDLKPYHPFDWNGNGYLDIQDFGYYSRQGMLSDKVLDEFRKAWYRQMPEFVAE